MKFTVIEPAGDWNGTAIFFLPGRNNDYSELQEIYSKPIVEFNNEKEYLTKSILVGINPPHGVWYPMPKGPKNQKDAVSGMIANSYYLDQEINDFLNKREIAAEKTVLIGHSAGAVMAIHVGTNFKNKLAGIVSHSGCLLEPNLLEQAKYDTPFYLIHSKDDNCFTWSERYLPTKNALKNKGYNIHVNESGYGHQVDPLNVRHSLENIAAWLQLTVPYE